jgi:hypothetical protein
MRRWGIALGVYVGARSLLSVIAIHMQHNTFLSGVDKRISAARRAWCGGEGQPLRGLIQT